MEKYALKIFVVSVVAFQQEFSITFANTLRKG